MKKNEISEIKRIARMNNEKQVNENRNVRVREGERKWMK